MRISALAARSGVPVGTIKYYLREGLVPPGRQTSRTTAEYDESHVERLRLVRALTDTGGLGIAAVRRVVAVIDAPDPARLDVLATAHDALIGGGAPEPDEADGEASESDEDDGTEVEGRARRWAVQRGWFVPEGDAVIGRLERAWAACEQADVIVDEAMLDQYADAVEQVARVDVTSVPVGAEGAVRRVVVGTVLTEPVLSALRLLAQRQVSLQRYRHDERL